jgi:cytidine deaminase
MDARTPEMLSALDRELVDAACDAIKRRYRNDWQEVGAALRSRSGQIVTGVNLDAYVGRMGVCAEGVAIGKLVTDLGEIGIDTIVAVRHPRPHEPDQSIRIVSPCGICRELISDYDPEARVIIMGEDGPMVVPVRDLLPNKYSRGAGL